MKIKIVEHVRHDGESYGPGDVVDFPDDVAAKIIQVALAVTHEDISSDQGDTGDSPDQGDTGDSPDQGDAGDSPGDVPSAPKKGKKKGN